MAQEGDPWREARVEAGHSTWESGSLRKGGTACFCRALGRGLGCQLWIGIRAWEGGKAPGESF